MGKDMMIEILKSQLETSNATNKALLLQIETLNHTIAGLEETVRRLEGLLQERDSSLAAAQSKARSLSKIAFPKSEKRKPESQAMTQEEILQKDAERAEAVKARGNNGAKRNMHFEMETVTEDVYPDGVDSLEGCTRISERSAVRYSMIPPRFIKHVYNLITLRKDDIVYSAKAPLAPLQNSSFDGSFIAGISQLRYLYSMPVERIVNLFRNNGFDIDKSTAHGLLAKTAGLFENLYEALRLAVHQDDYVICDETYHTVMDRTHSGGSLKAYIWGILAAHTKLVCFLYENGSRSQTVIFNEMDHYRGLIQSDGLAAYKNLEKRSNGAILRAACLQHCKRPFLDKELEGNPDAETISDLCNELYRNEHLHTEQEDWSVEDNLEWRRRYAPPILKELKEKLESVYADEMKYPPSSTMHRSAQYMLNEWSGIETIFTRGDVSLDTNAIERLNRYISLSRKNSMFFGSHAGAKRACVFYSLACSCRLQGIDFFEYLTDVLNRSAKMPGNAGPEDFRNLLPDRWKKKE